MTKLIDEFRRGWLGISQPSPLFSVGFAAACVALATVARWLLSLIRPDVFFTPYIPAVFFATAFGGARVGIVTALASGALGVTVNFGDTTADSARFALLVISWAVCGLTIWGVEHYRSIASNQRRIAKRLIHIAAGAAGNAVAADNQTNRRLRCEAIAKCARLRRCERRASS